MCHADSTQNQLQMDRVKNTKDSGIIIGCRSKEDNKKLKKLLKEKLS